MANPTEQAEQRFRAHQAEIRTADPAADGQVATARGNCRSTYCWAMTISSVHAVGLDATGNSKVAQTVLEANTPLLPNR